MKNLDIERKRASDLQRLQGLRLLDDDFMSKVFEDTACTQLLLEVILEGKTLEVQEVHSQHGIKNLQGRSVRLDILATDQNGRLYNVEIQRDDRGSIAKRGRYNSSLLDANITRPGDTYEHLAETYIIFITEHDVLKAGLPLYHIERVIQETGALYEDEAHILYVNAQIKDETALGKLMHDFSCTNAKDMHYKVLADRVQYFKGDQKGVETMCKAMEDMRKEERLETQYEFAVSLWADGIHDLDRIARLTKLPLEAVKDALRRV